MKNKVTQVSIVACSDTAKQKPKQNMATLQIVHPLVSAKWDTKTTCGLFCVKEIAELATACSWVGCHNKFAVLVLLVL